MHTRYMFGSPAKDELPVVLLVDDDLVSREVTATLLTMAGYTVHSAESGGEAVKALENGNYVPDAILMDAQMPGLSGKELIAELRLNTKAAIYTISGSEPPSDIIAATDGFLLKPFDVNVLKKLLDGRKPELVPPRLDPSVPVVKADVLAQFRKMMPEPAVRQIYTAVVTDLSTRIEALGVAISKGDSSEVRRIGHAIKGGCGMAGAAQAAHLGALLEAVSLGPEDNQLDNSAALLRDLRAAVQELERMLDSELSA
jgi:CheY-like chemotaxis protein